MKHTAKLLLLAMLLTLAACGETGDVLDDAVFERNQRVMEKFNVNFTWEIGTNEYSDLGKTSILAGGILHDTGRGHQSVRRAGDGQGQ